MRTILAAAAITLAPTLAFAGDMQAFAESAAQAKAAQVAGNPVIPSPMFLTRQSDFSVFFKAHVPAAIQQEALRIFWLTHPELTQPTQAAPTAAKATLGAVLSQKSDYAV